MHGTPKTIVAKNRKKQADFLSGGLSSTATRRFWQSRPP